MTTLRIAFFSFSFAAAVGCAALGAGAGLADEMGGAPEISPGVLKGYLPKEAVPDSAALLPPPPAMGSAAEALDQEIARDNLTLRGTRALEARQHGRRPSFSLGRRRFLLRARGAGHSSRIRRGSM